MYRKKLLSNHVVETRKLMRRPPFFATYVEKFIQAFLTWYNLRSAASYVGGSW